jgi:hypothetical protein
MVARIASVLVTGLACGAERGNDEECSRFSKVLIAGGDRLTPKRILRRLPGLALRGRCGAGDRVAMVWICRYVRLSICIEKGRL